MRKIEFQLFDDPLRYVNALLDDIANAQKYVYIEVYRFGHDAVGKKIREALRKKLLLNTEVKLLVDSWGTGRVDPFFNVLTDLKAEVRAFSRIRLNINFFSNSHRRNHRKIIIIDDEISYVGSANLTGYGLSWRESILRITDTDMALKLKEAFLQMFRLYNTYLIDKKEYVKTLEAAGMKILRDIPSLRRQPIKKAYLQLIRGAQENIFMETPYFLPSNSLRRALIAALNRKVNITLITPKHSDVRIVDILRNKYFGLLHAAGMKIKLYGPDNLHAKLFMVDNQTFTIGSPNFDYRSFRFQHEIMLVGQNPQIINWMRKHIHESISDSDDFNFEHWKNRSRLERLFEWLIVPFRHLL